MSNHDDGGPAFPFPTTGTNGETATGVPWAASPGMSLRDWFAGQAMLGILANPHTNMRGCKDQKLQAEVWCRLANYSYAIADAMLAARKESRP